METLTWVDVSLGSLRVIQNLTLSPNSVKHSLAYSSNQSATSLLSQPPLSSRAWGRSQWYRVTAGVIPAARRALIRLL